MGRTIVGIVTFIIAFVIVLGILQFVVRLSGAILKLGIGAVVALVAAYIAFAIAKNVMGTGNS